ncbi:hypothetical protein EYF80_064127 [Liparis tanakae]|uniref:Uncharacterized protein n=1 Tax=Liparis tanakae TaxID=230148 RepID=A0A4Z2EAG5_9TELE|nr:hypothetical protein EYF80_064127 [Liparis tanakae]
MSVILQPTDESTRAIKTIIMFHAVRVSNQGSFGGLDITEDSSQRPPCRGFTGGALSSCDTTCVGGSQH